MLQFWRITPARNLKLETDASTLDEITQGLPEGYYSTFRTFDGGRRVLGLTAHLRRLYDPVAAPEVDQSTLRRQLSMLLEPFRPGEARVRAVMTKQGEVYLAIAALALLPREIYENGVRVETTEMQRQHPRLKSTGFIGRSDAERRHIARKGIFEALLVKDGKILEGMTSNFFYVVQRDGRPRLCTASEDILLGITRETVIEIARGRGLDVQFQPLELSLLGMIDEAFITSSSRGIVPVAQIDRAGIGQGKPGPITKDLTTFYEGYVIERAETI
jgi:branched-subunit amino acid aminotransferase/4-amino-4-deoxychorismate lyase